MRVITLSLWVAFPAVFITAAAIGQSPGRDAANEEVTAWARSGHANFHSPSFTYWNDAGSIPPVCSTCHSGAGFRSLHGFDGSAPGLPENPIPVGGVVDCATCHSPGLAGLTEIKLPSGVSHPVSGSEASCMTCHQGRASSATIERAVAQKGDDDVDEALSFINPHYAIAAASLLGSTGALGYQYPGKTYEARFRHAPPVTTCTSCHDPHSLTVAEETCLSCHQTGSARDIRISRISHDGSGNLSQGIHADIVANRKALSALIDEYAREVAGTPIVYMSRHPYFFADHNDDGQADQRDGAATPYRSWTPRLLKAAYNWKFVGSDAGIHVHNPHYALQLLHDSAEDLSAALGRELTGMTR